MNKINLITYADTEYMEYVNSFLLPTLPESIKTIDIIFASYFPPTSYLQMIQRLEAMRDKIITYSGKQLMYLDADVVIVKDFTNDVLNRLKEYDILFQNNTQWYNSGIWAANCNDKTLNLFNKFINELKKDSKFLDQTIIWEVINSFDIKHASLPISYFAGHFDQCKFPQFPDEVFLYHATNTYSSQEKRNALEYVKKRFSHSS